MDISGSLSTPSEPNIGRVFTPLSWAQWLICESGAYAAWENGATVLDPTAGRGVFLESFIATAVSRGRALKPSDIDRLHAIEIVEADKKLFLARISQIYDIDFPADNFVTADFLTFSTPIKFDVLAGNPPWVNFADLPPHLKGEWGPLYLATGLVKNRKDVLLGGSRADVATLVLKKALDEALAQRGFAAFFLPLSIFFNGGANDLFRPYPGSHHNYRVTSLWDFAGEDIFNGISTRYGAAKFEAGKSQLWPVRTFVRRGDSWADVFSTASDYRSGHWLRHHSIRLGESQKPTISITEYQRPRQGINTCGANDVFIFDRRGDDFVSASGEVIRLEPELMFPLMIPALFGNSRRPSRERWILVPHDRRTGRPLEAAQLSNYNRTYDYLMRQRSKLVNRKGTLLRGQIMRGYWWALLGVGPYSFAQWKVAWEALGKSTFRPVVLKGYWQGNQALHAFCPCSSELEAMRLCRELASPQVEEWLKSSSMGGTRNWAQPGRLAKLLSIIPKQDDLLAATL